MATAAAICRGVTIKMHIGFRYHIASLVAVFFSLFLGILMGSVLFQDDLLVQEQNQIIGDLESKFNDLQQSTELLKDELTLATEKEEWLYNSWEQVREIFIGNKLQNHDVVLLTSKSDFNPNRLINLIESAGATVCAQLSLTSEFNDISMQINELEFKDGRTITVIVVLEAMLLEMLETAVEYFDQKGWLISLFLPYNSEYMVSQFAHNTLIIEAADTPIGEVALIEGLARELKGSYGYTKHAESFWSLLSLE